MPGLRSAAILTVLRYWCGAPLGPPKRVLVVVIAFNQRGRRWRTRGHHFVVGDTGIEPVTSSVSGKRATAAPIARRRPVSKDVPAAVSEVATGFEPVCTALQAAASPLGHATRCAVHGANRETSLERMTRFELATLTLAR